MENGGRGGNNVLESKFQGLTLEDIDANNNYNNLGEGGLFQVIKAVDAADILIKQQVEENNRLRSELQKKLQELETYKSRVLKTENPQVVEQWSSHVQGSKGLHHIEWGIGMQTNEFRDNNSTSGHDLANNVVSPKDVKGNEDHMLERYADNHNEFTEVNGTLKEAASECLGLSQLSSPSTTPLSPSRYQVGEYDLRMNLSGRHVMTLAGMNNSNNSKQDLTLKMREHDEETLQLRKHLAEYSVKEAQILNEKYVLEKRIAYMRLAFDQQQQDLVDAASKAISYRQDIIEENIRLAYALQAAQQERSTFVSSLMPLLAEYSLQPPAADAQSIVSNVKVLFRHLQEQLLVSEAKLKEFQYQLTPWRSDVNTSNFAPSALHPTQNKDGLELVPQEGYSDDKIQVSTGLQRTDHDRLALHQSGSGDGVSKNVEPDDLERYSPLARRNAVSREVPGELAVSHADLQRTPNNVEASNKHVTFGELVSLHEMDDNDMDGHQNDRDDNWVSNNTPYATITDDPSTSYSPYLPPVMEEPSSSFSEAADDDPLPAIEGLQISGEAFPGRELQACGYSINGTTSCNFEWVRHLEDGSFIYIDGAKQPIYLITADDVDTYLAIEVQPLDNRKRKGELVKVFANEHRKITCDPNMQSCIERNLYSGHVSYKVSLSTGYLDIWEPATFVIKRDGFSIKCSGPSGIVVTEKFSPSVVVSIPFGSPSEFSILDSQGVERVMRTEANLTDSSCSRDTIVLTMRLFMMRAGQKKKGKKRGLFFNK